MEVYFVGVLYCVVVFVVRLVVVLYGVFECCEEFVLEVGVRVVVICVVFDLVCVVFDLCVVVYCVVVDDRSVRCFVFVVVVVDD